MFAVQLLENLWLVTGKFVTSDIRDACLYKTREEAKEEILRLKRSNECLKRDAEWARDDTEDVKIRLFAGFIFLIVFVSVFFVF